MYPIPYEYYEKYAVRKYGAHGTSHRYISERAADLLEEDIRDLKLITCHLGNGCSISAIDHGVAVDTSMGMTPLDGLMMGTRCGSIDPAIVTYIMEKEGLTPKEMNDILNKKSGLYGVSGISNDLRSVDERAEHGDERALLAYEMYSNSAKKFIGQYIAVMGGVDCIVLTGGVGENSAKMRRMIFAGLQTMGIMLDYEKNRTGPREREISTDDSEVLIVIIPTDEELMIAHDTYELVHDLIADPDIDYNEDLLFFSDLCSPSLLRLDARDGHDAVDVVGGATTRKVVHGSGYSLRHRTVRLRLREALHQLVADVARIEVGEHEHVGLAGNRRARRLRRTHLGDDRGVELQFAVERELGSELLRDARRFYHLGSVVVLGRTVR